MNRLAVLAVTAVTVLTVALPAAADPTDAPTQRVDRGQPTATGRVVIGDGHLDIGPHLQGDDWRLAIHDDRTSTPVWRRPSDVAIRVHDAAELTAPRAAPYAFLGDAQGKRVYVIPQTQNRDVVWTGWNTQDPNVLDAITLGATFTLHGVQGPGRLHVFLQSGTGGPPQLLWTSAKRVAQPLFVEANTHTHANWVFTAPGTYLVDFGVSATLRSGRTVTDRQTLRFVVGDATPVGFAAAPVAPSTTAPQTTVAAAPAADATRNDDGSATWLVAGGIVVAVLAGGVLIGVQGRSRRRRADAAIAGRDAS